jgi:phosphoglycerol transferase MdoB-like AlkP superfamily enzyme
MSEKTNIQGSMITGLLTVAFIVLKLTKVIDWSWWWVLSPFLIPLVLGLVMIAVWVLLVFVKEKHDNTKQSMTSEENK